MGWLWIALLVASCSAICENSPLTVPQLRGILGAALKDLSTPSWKRLFPLIPNLISGTNTSKDCNPNGSNASQVANCGYPSAFITSNAQGGQIEESWRFLQDPDLGYAGALINQTKLLPASRTDPIQLADVATQMDCGDAIIWLGCTPSVTYYAYSKLLWAMNPPLNSSATQILGSLGDSLNNFRIKTARTNPAIAGGGATLIVYTAYNKTYDTIASAFVQAGFPVSAINVDPLPTNLIELGKKGAYLGFGSRNSNLSLSESAYLFTPNTGYFAANAVNFPYVHLRPAAGLDWLYCVSGDEISPLPVWIPVVDQTQTVPPKATMAASEHIYEPRLLSAVTNITVALTHALASLTNYHFTIYPQLATYLDEFGEKYIFEHKYAQHGGGGTRDNAYYNFHPGLLPIYGTQNFSISVGLRHESIAWTSLGKATPHATFWNIAYSDATNVGSLMRFNHLDADLQAWNGLPFLGAGAGSDPLNVIWVRTTGVTSTTDPAITAVLSGGLKLHVPHDDPLAFKAPMAAIHHAYANPDTGVAPWGGSIIAPIQIHVIGVKLA